MATTRPRPAALPYLSVANAREAIAWYVDAFGRVPGRRADRDGRRPHRPCRAGDRRRRALPGRRVSRARPESACAASGFGEPDAARRRHRRRTGAGARARRRRSQREAYENYGSRSATIIDPFGHRWMLSGPVTGAPVQIQHGDVGYVSVWTPDADRAAGVLRPRARLELRPARPIRSPTPSSASASYSVRRSADAVLLLRGGRPRRRAAGDRRRRRHGRRDSQQFDFGTVRRSHRSAGQRRSRVYQPNPGQPRPELNGVWARRTFVHHVSGARLGRVPGVLQPGAVLDVRAGPDRRRLAGAAEPSDGGGRRRQRRAR